MALSKKGLELPVNMLVLLAIAVIVLLSAVAWFILTFSGTTQSQTQAQQFQSCCSKYVVAGCPGDATKWPADTITPVCGFNDNGAGGGVAANGDQEGAEPDWTLKDLAARLGIAQSSADIKKACGCAGA